MLSIYLSTLTLTQLSTLSSGRKRRSTTDKRASRVRRDREQFLSHRRDARHSDQRALLQRSCLHSRRKEEPRSLCAKSVQSSRV